MKVFISHNTADKPSARAFATMLVEQGVDVWFDEWDIRPGESIVGGIEEGLRGSDVFALLWSKPAHDSRWVDIEVRAIVRRRVEEDGLRIVPLMLDDTPLPALVADYRGFDLSEGGVSLQHVVEQLTGSPRDIEVAKALQRKVIELTEKNVDPSDPFGILVCPSCSSDKLARSTATDYKHDENYYIIAYEDCGWGDWTQ